MAEDFLNAVEFSHFLIEKYADKNGVLIDATAGNGKDTKFLAEFAGDSCRILAFDIQAEAAAGTKALLKSSGLEDKVEVYNDSHTELDKYISENEISAVIYNLGYLPGGNKEITTEAETTIKALEKNLAFLKKYGIIILVIYTGHPGGIEEKEAVFKFAEGLDHKKYNVMHYEFINQVKNPPEVLAIIKREQL
ncbi:MAG: tRNA (mnm(5)s(2)U34)-methyltransferase [Halanaerobium sp.]